MIAANTWHRHVSIEPGAVLFVTPLLGTEQATCSKESLLSIKVSDTLQVPTGTTYLASDCEALPSTLLGVAGMKVVRMSGRHFAV